MNPKNRKMRMMRKMLKIIEPYWVSMGRYESLVTVKSTIY
jgi:hypothetical protein